LTDEKILTYSDPYAVVTGMFFMRVQ
jgi:hypothetical protein